MPEYYVRFDRRVSRYIELHAAVNPNLINNKDNFLIKLRLNFPELPIKKIEKDTHAKEAQTDPVSALFVNPIAL